MRKTSVYLPARLKAALAARAAASGRSEAEVLRAALEAEVHAAGPVPGMGGERSAAEAPVAGRLMGIGVGPGDADLLTLRAVHALRRADRVVAPSTAVDAVGRAETIVRQAVPGVRVERIAFTMAPGRGERDRAVARAGRLEGAVAGELLGMPGERIGPLSDLAADGPASYLATVIVPARGER